MEAPNEELTSEHRADHFLYSNLVSILLGSKRPDVLRYVGLRIYRRPGYSRNDRSQVGYILQ